MTPPHTEGLKELRMTSGDIIDALVALSDDKIWATELAAYSGARRIDFWTLEPTQSCGFRACSYEIKVTRQDFKRDDEEKQAFALKWCDRFYYVTPPSLIQKNELPKFAGLLEWDGKSFRVIRKPPKLEKSEPSWPFIVSLLRNSGDCRRDVGLLKAQVAYFKYAAEEEKRRVNWNRQFANEKWKRSALKSRAAIGEKRP